MVEVVVVLAAKSGLQARSPRKQMADKHRPHDMMSSGEGSTVISS